MFDILWHFAFVRRRSSVITQQKVNKLKKHHPFGWCFLWRRRRDLNPRYPFGVYTISNRARSASYATSPSFAISLLILLYSQSFVKPYFSFSCSNITKRLTSIWKHDIIAKLSQAASVAQSVVHLTRNEKVACSSQVTSSKKELSHWDNSFLIFKKC